MANSNQLLVGYYDLEPEPSSMVVPMPETVVFAKKGLAIPSANYLIPLGLAAALLLYMKYR